MKTWLAFLSFLTVSMALGADPIVSAPGKTVMVIPVHADIEPPLVYLIRRGVKQASEEKADLLVLDIRTYGGRIDTTEDIISILAEFKGDTVAYVNDRAISAGAFIAVATKRIFMAPQSVIGAAAPVQQDPTGQIRDIPGTMEIKTKSVVRALVRRMAEKNGHNIAVIESMIDKNKELRIDGVVLNEKGDLLTLTDEQASKSYGTPPRPLLSEGTVESLGALLAKLGYSNARRIEIKPTGAERLGTWINAISPVLLIIGVIGLYIEFKTPGFGAPGIIGIAAFAIYFAGGYIAGFSGFEWLLAFAVGVILLAMEFFIFPGTVALGVGGGILMILAVVMALVDLYPGPPTVPGGISWPTVAGPTGESLGRALRVMLIAILGTAFGVWLASKWLPKTALYASIVSRSASGAATTAAFAAQENKLLGKTGVTISPLYPGGKAQFGDAILDVMSQGDMIGKGAAVRIVGFSGGAAIVEAV